MKAKSKTRHRKIEGRDVVKRVDLAGKELHDLQAVAKMTGYCVRYLRQLCHRRKVDHHKLLGRYYMTPEEVAALVTPVKAEGTN